MTRKILSVIGTASIALLGACGGGTTTTPETPDAVLVPATRTVPVYEKVDVDSPDSPDTPEMAPADTPDDSPQIEIDVDD
jgi:hypothetical protein